MTVDLLTTVALDEDLVDVEALVAASEAVLHRDDHDRAQFWLQLRPAAAPHEVFVARIAWSRYPDAPPSVKFATAVAGRLDVTSAWPIIPGYRAGSFDICQPFTAEGFQVHPEWVRCPQNHWPTNGNPFLWVVDTLLSDMAGRYQGRSG